MKETAHGHSFGLWLGISSTAHPIPLLMLMEGNFGEMGNKNQTDCINHSHITLWFELQMSTFTFVLADRALLTLKFIE